MFSFCICRINLVSALHVSIARELWNIYIQSQARAMSILRTALMKRGYTLSPDEYPLPWWNALLEVQWSNASKSPRIRPVDQCAFHEYASVFEFSILVGFHLSNISIVIRLCVFHFNFTVIVVLKLIKYVFQPQMSVMFACLHGICSKLSESLALFKIIRQIKAVR